jgi:hypothetical protein
MSGAVHLQNRLDAEDIKHIFALSDQGIGKDEISSRYKLSKASVDRILACAWNEKQIAAWGQPPRQTRVRSSMRKTEPASEPACMCPHCQKVRAENGIKLETDPSPRKRTYLPFSGEKKVDTAKLSAALADYIEAVTLLREIREAAMKAGASEAMLEAIRNG